MISASSICRSPRFLISLIAAAACSSCGTSGPAGLFARKTPHQQYEQKLTDAGLHQTAMGRGWLDATKTSLSEPVSIAVPYQETGYFDAATTRAAGFLFTVKRGQKLTCSVTKRSSTNCMLYLDLWKAGVNGNGPEHLAFADTAQLSIHYDAEDDGPYLITLQPELLRGGEYTLTITAGPSLAFPLKKTSRSQVQSFFGNERDAGTRKHEGVDIFSSFHTPVLASADGIISSVTTNTLGGKVVFLHPNRKNYTLYYAHLDSQLAKTGQQMRLGDTVGLMGKTGNAATTSPHLHFGIYTSGGAVDPLPFIDPLIKEPPAILFPLTNLNRSLRLNRRTSLYGATDTELATENLQENTLLQVVALTGNSYRVILPDGRKGFVAGIAASVAASPIKNQRLTAAQPLYDAPDTSAARKSIVQPGTVAILGRFNNFHYITSGGLSGWILTK